MKKNRILALILALVMSMGTVVYATEEVDTAGGLGSTAMELTAEGIQFKALVPLKLPFYIDQEGVVYVAGSGEGFTGATGLYIQNMSAAPIEVVSAKIDLTSSVWELDDYDLDEVTVYGNKKVNTKEYGLKINGAKADKETGIIDVTNETFALDETSGSWAIIGSNGFDSEVVFESTEDSTKNILEIVYDAKFAPQSVAIDEATNIGALQLTLDFDDNELIGQ